MNLTLIPSAQKQTTLLNGRHSFKLKPDKYDSVEISVFLKNLKKLKPLKIKN